MARVGPNTPKTPKIPPRGWLLPVLVLALLAAVAAVVMLTGHPASDVPVVIGTLTPVAFVALGRRRAG